MAADPIVVSYDPNTGDLRVDYPDWVPDAWRWVAPHDAPGVLRYNLNIFYHAIQDNEVLLLACGPESLKAIRNAMDACLAFCVQRINHNATTTTDHTAAHA